MGFLARVARVTKRFNNWKFLLSYKDWINMDKYGLTKVTRRGQITIPAEAREKLGIGEDDYVAVYGSESILLLKKTSQPDLNQRLEEALKQGMELAKEKKITRKTVEGAVEVVRHG